MLKRLSAIVLMFVLILGVTLSYGNDELKKKERELNDLKQELNELDKSIDNNKSLQSETNQKINGVTKNVKSLEKEINHFSKRISETEGAIVQKEEALKESEANIEKKNELLNDRLRVMYKTGEVGYIEVLFGAEDFGDLLSRIDMVQLILAHDQDLLVTMKAARDDIEAQKVALLGEKNQLSVLMNEKKKKQTALNSSLNELVDYKKELATDAAALKEMEDKMLREADNLTESIKNLKVVNTPYVGGKMLWPVPGRYNVSSPFGQRIHPITKVYSMHTGIDIPAKMGTPVVAAQSGTVVYADWLGTYGKVIIIDHGGGLSTLYAHNSALYAAVGQTVNKGDTICGIGTTGYSTGPHSHFEVRENGKYVNPLNYVKGN